MPWIKVYEGVYYDAGGKGISYAVYHNPEDLTMDGVMRDAKAAGRRGGQCRIKRGPFLISVRRQRREGISKVQEL